MKSVRVIFTLSLCLCSLDLQHCGFLIQASCYSHVMAQRLRRIHYSIKRFLRITGLSPIQERVSVSRLIRECCVHCFPVSTEGPPDCWICLDAGDVRDLFKPCKCPAVHRQCLHRWVTEVIKLFCGDLSF